MNSYNYMASYFVEILPSPSYVLVLLSVHYTSCLKLCNLISHPFDGYSSVVEKSRRKERTILNWNSIPKESDSWASKWESLVPPTPLWKIENFFVLHVSAYVCIWNDSSPRYFNDFPFHRALLWSTLDGNPLIDVNSCKYLEQHLRSRKIPSQSRLGASDELNG